MMYVDYAGVMTSGTIGTKLIIADGCTAYDLLHRMIDTDSLLLYWQCIAFMASIITAKASCMSHDEDKVVLYQMFMLLQGVVVYDCMLLAQNVQKIFNSTIAMMYCCLNCDFI